MSAERECFKRMKSLLEEKRQFEAVLKEESVRLIKTALQEFIEDHPEVNLLIFTIDPPFFAVELHSQRLHFHEAHSKVLTEGNLKLSVCLQALQENFVEFKEVVVGLYGNGIVKIPGKAIEL